MRLKMNNRSHRYDITRPRPRHGHKYTIYTIERSYLENNYFKKRTDHSLKPYRKQKYYSHLYKKETKNFQQRKSLFCQRQ